MTATERRIRQFNDRLQRTRQQAAAIEASLRELENQQSLAMGYRVPLREPALLSAMDRENCRGL